MNKINYCIYILLILISASCAMPVSPTGGDKDATPPLIIKTNPANKTTNIYPEKIIISFNENIQVTSADQNIIISPKVGKLKVAKSNKSISIHLHKDSLKPNTTYTILLNDAISDLNEGNKARFAPILFSTGPSADTAQIVGTISSLEKPKNPRYKIICYDSNNYNTGPLFNSIIPNSVFGVYGLNNSAKTVLVFNDENSNNKADSFEEIGYKKNVLPGKDSLRILTYSRAKASVQLYENNHFYYFSGISPLYLNNFTTAIPATFKFKDTLATSQENLPMILDGLPQHLYLKPTVLTDKKNSPLQYYFDKDILDSNTHIRITFNKPIKALNQEPIKCVSATDSNRLIPFTIQQTMNTVKIIFPPSKEAIKIILPKYTVIFTDDKPNQLPFTYKYEITEQTAGIEFTNTRSIPCVINIKKDRAVYTFSIQPNSSLNLHVPRGTYTAYYFFDSDTDNALTPPKPLNQLEGETLINLSDIVAKPGLINTILLK